VCKVKKYICKHRLELVKGRINTFVQVLRSTGLTGLLNRSDRLVADNCVKCFNLQDQF